MTVKTFIFNPYQVNTYLLYDETNECVIIDPGCYFHKEADQIFSFVTQKNLRPVKILITHCHFDHMLGISDIFEMCKAEIIINNNDLFLYNQMVASAKRYGVTAKVPVAPSGFIDHNQEIHFGNSFLKALHCPGHSPGSIVYYNQVQKFIIAGDVLFNGSIGRTDLAGGDMDTLISSITEKLMVLDDETIVYCGHGDQTTIGRERTHNPFL
jgi:glyoxylase-like metal-dependent hydrolase (beta-lactamase superfamily II)